MLVVLVLFPTEKAPKLNILRMSENQGKYTLHCISEIFAAEKNLREF
jgi:hypothetical protein